jgi:ribosomal protein L11 methyltransferase
VLKVHHHPRKRSFWQDFMVKRDSTLEQALEPAVDWHEQWAQFAPHFKEGYAHLDCGLRLAPGGGFGDLSHPTTRLMLRLLEGRCAGQVVLDIGCGSGVLTLAAVKMGASHAYGIDIDPVALQHATHNQQLNELENQTTFSSTWQGPATLILMNMISSEQQVAWNPRPFNTLITSGILSSQREAYLKWASSQGWTLLEEHQEDDWLSFLFT